jgi:hypothetical protein
MTECVGSPGILPDFFGKQQRGKPSKIDLPVGDGDFGLGPYHVQVP